MVIAFLLLGSSPASRTEREAEERRAATSEAGAPQEALAIPTRTVDSEGVRQTEARTRIDISGVLEPVRKVVIGAEVGGRVVSLDAEEHTAVAKDEVLVQLDAALPQAAVARARAAVLRAQAAESLASAELARQTELSSQGVASAAVFDRAVSEGKSAAAEVAEARASLLEAETRLEKTRIRAPFDGVVSSLDLEPGAYLQPGMAVAEIADLAEVEIEVGLSDQQILSVSHGLAVEISVQALPGRRFDGRVVRPGRTADAKTRKYPVAVRVANPEDQLLAGMLGTVHFELGNAESVIRLPSSAVFWEFDLAYVYVLVPGDSGSQAERRRIQTRPIPFRPELIEVTEGLKSGERVATSGVGELRDGLLVRERRGAAASRADSEKPAS